MITKRKSVRKFLQYVSISIEPVAILGIVLICLLSQIPGVKALVPYLAWPVGISVVIFILQLEIVAFLAPDRLSGVVLRSHVRKFYFGRCVIGRILLGTRDLKQEKVNVIRIQCGSRMYKVIVNSAELTPPGTKLRLKFVIWDEFIRLPIYGIVPAAPAKRQQAA